MAAEVSVPRQWSAPRGAPEGADCAPRGPTRTRHVAQKLGHRDPGRVRATRRKAMLSGGAWRRVQCPAAACEAALESWRHVGHDGIFYSAF